jgi:hypothetical protein
MQCATWMEDMGDAFDLIGVEGKRLVKIEGQERHLC